MGARIPVHQENSSNRHGRVNSLLPGPDQWLWRKRKESTGGSLHVLSNVAMQKCCSSADVFHRFICKRYSIKFPHYPATEKGHSCIKAFWQELLALGPDVIQSYSEYYTAAAWPSPVMLIIRAFLAFQMELISFSSLSCN